MKGRVEYLPGAIPHPVCSRPHNATGALADPGAVEEAGTIVDPVVASGVAATMAEVPAGDAVGAHADAIRSVSTAATDVWALFNPTSTG